MTKVQFLELPANLQKFLADGIIKTRESLMNETYVGQEGEIRWSSNRRAVPVDVFRDSYAVAPAKQAEVCAADNSAFIAEYIESQKNCVPSAEEMFEMRAAFGPGTKVVNVFTGKSVRL